MRNSVSYEVLLNAARKVVTTFPGRPREPVPVRDVTRLGYGELAEVPRRYEAHGFCTMELLTDTPSPRTLTLLARSLGLGEPFLPPLYTLGGAPASAVSTISAGRNTGTADADHPSFGRTDGQRMHTDGTLQDIGEVKASVLVCEAAAAEGGATMLFNTSAAFAELIMTDPAAAVALATPGTLVRRANISGCQDQNAGPVLAVLGSELVCRYSVTDTDSWAVPNGVDEAGLRRGIDFLATASSQGSPYYSQLTLSAGQAIVFDNTKISHGRTQYRDLGERPRCMYRGLYLNHPRVDVR